MVKIGINGFGRIGRYFTRMSLLQNDIQVVHINDLAPIETLAHLFKYDSVHGKLGYSIEVQDNCMIVNGRKILFSAESAPEKINWGTQNVDIVVESTGRFRTSDLIKKHLKNGVKKVVLSVPPTSEDIPTVVLGVNDEVLNVNSDIISNASCTTNSAAPMVKILNDLCDIESCYITTVHSYTNDQSLHDSPHKDLRRARAAAQSIIPTTTGAAKAITKIFPELDGQIGGCGIRVPVPDGSLTDLTCVVKNTKSVEEINNIFKSYSKNELKGILEYTTDPIVSIDIIGNNHSCIFDAQLTSVIGNMVKVVGWYDNEAGYSNRLIDLILRIKDEI